MEKQLDPNKLGFLPKEGEDQEAFITRFSSRIRYPEITIPELDLTIDWVELKPLEGAPLWIGGMTEIEGDCVSIYTRKNSKEVLAHEAIHAIRHHFNQEYFEEILAFSTSASGWRRVFGSVLSSKLSRAIFFLFSTVACFAVWMEKDLYVFLPFFLLIFLGAHTLQKQRILRKALRNIEKAFPYAPTPLSVAIRMFDKEIVIFANSSKEQIEQFLLETTELRWKLIKTSYR